MASCSASFTQSTYTQGQTITANFTWSGATSCNTDPSGNRMYCYICYYETDPDCTSPVAAGSSTFASGTNVPLTFDTNTGTPTGTYIASIYVYNNQVHCTITNCTSSPCASCELTSSGVSITVSAAGVCSGITCPFGSVSVNNCYPYPAGPPGRWIVQANGASLQVIISLAGANADQFVCTGCGTHTIPSGGVHNVDVQFCPLSAGDKTATLTIFCPSTIQTFTYTLTGTGSGGVNVYGSFACDSTHVCDWSTGPFTAGQNQEISSSLYIQNTGTTTGTIYLRFAYWTGTAWSSWFTNCTTTGCTDCGCVLAPGAIANWTNIWANIPSTVPSGTIWFAAAVWGDSEGPPVIPPPGMGLPLDSNVMITSATTTVDYTTPAIALLAVGGLGLLWWTLKKHHHGK